MRKVLYLFGHINDQDISFLARAGQLETVTDKTILIEEGKPTTALYILMDGQLAVSVAGIGVIARIGVGDVVGEMSFVSSALPSASVSAEGTCKVYRIAKKTLDNQLARNTDFASRFYYSLALFLTDRLRGTVQRLGYGKRTDPEPDLSDSELDPTVLDKVAIAGIRFERFMQLLSEGPGGNG